MAIYQGPFRTSRLAGLFGGACPLQEERRGLGVAVANQLLKPVYGRDKTLLNRSSMPSCQSCGRLARIGLRSPLARSRDYLQCTMPSYCKSLRSVMECIGCKSLWGYISMPVHLVGRTGLGPHLPGIQDCWVMCLCRVEATVGLSKFSHCARHLFHSQTPGYFAGGNRSSFKSRFRLTLSLTRRWVAGGWALACRAVR